MSNLYQGQYTIDKTKIDINQLYKTTKIDRKFTFVNTTPVSETYFVSLPDEDSELFLFPSLNAIKRKMERAGYSQEEIASDIQGLSELPEYDSSERNAIGEE